MAVSERVVPAKRIDVPATFELAMEASPSGVLVIEPDEAIVLVNRDVERQFGYARDELVGQTVGDTARLNTIAHLLSLIPHKKLPRKKVKLPGRSTKRAYDDDATIARRRFVRERY